MMSRSRAVAVIAVPIAVLLAANDARVQAGTQAQAIRAVNELAPEHLELHVREPRSVLDRVSGLD